MRAIPRWSQVFVVVGALSPAAAWAQQQPAEAAVDARLRDVRNRVEVTPSHAPGSNAPPARPAADNEALPAGSHVTTHRDAECVVRYGALGELQVEEDTRLVMFGPEHTLPAGAPPVRDTTVVQGAVRVIVNGGAPNRIGALVLHTPGGMVSMSRGEFRVHVDSSRATRVAVYRGRARVSAGAQGFLMGPGTATRVDPSRPGVATFAPVPLPRSPVWTAPFPERVLALGGSAAAEARYAPPPAQRHPPHRWVQVLARDADFDDLVFERSVEPGVTAFRAERLPEGEYFARVVSVDAERFESLSSATQRFRVVAPRVIPGAPGRRAEVLVPEGIFCRLDNEVALDPGVPFALVPARAHELQCSTSADLRDPARIAIPAEQSGDLGHEARLDAQWTSAGGSAPLALRLTDASGRPFPYANITVRGGPGVTVDPLREEAERGLYTTRVTWAPNAPVALDFTVNGAVRFTERLGGPPAPTTASR